MSSKIGSLNVDLGLETARFYRGMDEAQKKMASAQKRFSDIGGKMQGLGAKMSIGLTAPFVAFGVSATKSAIDASDAIAQVNASLASMGPVAGRSIEQLQASGKELEKLSSFDDKEILRKVSANLLTFGNVAGEQFDRAQRAAVDMATKLNMDLQPATIQVGKALNDPVKGISALTRVGITFSEQQKEQIKSMVKAGDTAGAQGVILGELERQFKGAGKAARDAAPGSDAINKWSDLKEKVGTVLMEAMARLEPVLNKVLDAFLNLSPSMQTVLTVGAGLAATFGPLLLVAGSMVNAFGSLLPVLIKLGPAFKILRTAAMALMTSPPLLAFAAVVAGIYFAWQNWDKIKPIIDKVANAVTEFWQANVQPVFDAVMEKLRAVGTFFKDYFGAAIEGVVGTVSALLKGDFAGAWQAAKDAVSNMVTAVVGVLQSLAPGAVEAVRALYLGVKTWLQDKLGGVFNWLGDKVRAAGDAFYTLWDRVVGHSYIPDLVDGIGTHMARLQGNMVDVAVKATDKTAAAFRELQQRVAPILDRIFPSQARFNQFKRELADLQVFASKSGWSAPQTNKARDRLRDEFLTDGKEEAPLSVLSAKPLIDIDAQVEKTGEQIARQWDKTKAANENLTQSFADMARDVVGSFSSMVQNIKSGDIMGALQGVLDIVGQVSGIIGGTGKPATRTYSVGNNAGGFNASAGSFAVPKFANGGGGTIKGFPGIDSNLLSLNGNPIAKVSSGELLNVQRNPANDGGGGSARVTIVPTPYFDAHVQGQAAQVAAPMSVRAAAAGSAGAQTSMARSRKRSMS